MSRNSKKSLETEQKLKKSLLKYLSTTPIEKITIKEITFDARINRGTFYLHYKNINQLIAEVEDDIINGIRQILKKREADNSIEIKDTVSAVGNYLISHKAIIKILLFNQSGSFPDKVKDSMREGFFSILNSIPVKDEKQIELAISANFGVLMEWIQNKSQFDMAEYTEFVLEQTAKIISNFKNI